MGGWGGFTHVWDWYFLFDFQYFVILSYASDSKPEKESYASYAKRLKCIKIFSDSSPLSVRLSTTHKWNFLKWRAARLRLIVDWESSSLADLGHNHVFPFIAHALNIKQNQKLENNR